MLENVKEIIKKYQNIIIGIIVAPFGLYAIITGIQEQNESDKIIEEFHSNIRYISAGWNDLGLNRDSFIFEGLPQRNIGAPIYQQVGPEKWKETTQYLPDRTKVTFLRDVNTYLSLVETVEPPVKQYVVHVLSLSRKYYWDLPTKEALRYQSVIAQIKGDSVTVIDTSGEWKNVRNRNYQNVFCAGIADYGEVKGKAKCTIYNNGKKYIGSVFFDLNDLSTMPVW